MTEGAKAKARAKPGGRALTERASLLPPPGGVGYTLSLPAFVVSAREEAG